MIHSFPSPVDVYQDLFFDLLKSGLWSDEKTVADLLPKIAPQKILDQYNIEKDQPGFELKAFVDKYFVEEIAKNVHFQSDTSLPAEKHIENLWLVLERPADNIPPEGSSLIPLPYPYIVPGGRFNEIYYWDSYFTMLGLIESGRVNIVESMIQNFAHLIDQLGFIPNGNRTYFTGRSQPPFFALMIELLANTNGDQILLKYLPHLEKEYAFWMKGNQEVEVGSAHLRVVRVEKDTLLNRYWDNHPNPRPEMYLTDLETADNYEGSPEILYRNLRAACESGWDFSSRWLKDQNELTSIHTTDILPIDLNSLLYFQEELLYKCYALVGNKAKSIHYGEASSKRKEWIQSNFWDSEKGFFLDFDFTAFRTKTVLSLAGLFPLFCNIATKDQARQIAHVVEKKFLKPGGVVTTIHNSGQQWDAPNGWAPLQWITIQGLRNYGYNELADQIKENWVGLNVKVYKETGKMMEKYNVESMDLKSGGGEYPVQDGFGWTNGVLLKLLGEK